MCYVARSDLALINLMKILYISNMYPGMTPALPYAGVFVKEQIEAINRNCKQCKSKVFVIDGVSSKLNYLWSIFQIHRIIKRYQPDIIHIHYGLSALFLLFFPRYRKQCVVTLHGGDIMPQQKNWMQIFLTKKIIKHVAFVITLNREMEEIVSGLMPRYATIKCGVDINFFDCDLNSRKSGPQKVVIFPADPKRGVKDYPLFEKSIAYIKDKSAFDLKIIALSNMSREQVKNALCVADCMLLTSVSEGSPQVIKEAIACNLPIVSVDVGDVKEILEGIANCYVGNGRSAEELGEYVLAVLLEKAESDGRQHLIAKGLGNDNIAKSIIALYLSILN